MFKQTLEVTKINLLQTNIYANVFEINQSCYFNLLSFPRKCESFLGDYQLLICW